MGATDLQQDSGGRESWVLLWGLTFVRESVCFWRGEAIGKEDLSSALSIAGASACLPLDWDPLVLPRGAVAAPVRRIQNPTLAIHMGFQHGPMAISILS